MVSLPVTTYAFFSIELIDKYESIDTLGLRGGSKAAATSKMECFVIIVNGWQQFLRSNTVISFPTTDH